jgi:cell division inhibitor SepF
MGKQMNFIGKLKDSLSNLREEEEFYEYEVEDVEAPEPPRAPASKPARPRSSYDDFYTDSEIYNVKQIKPDITFDVVLAQPRAIEDATDVVNNLRVNHVCIINLEGVDLDTAQRIADFLGGATFAMNGSIERVNDTIFVMAPLGVNVKDLLKRTDKSNNLFAWVSKGVTKAANARF